MVLLSFSCFSVQKEGELEELKRRNTLVTDVIRQLFGSEVDSSLKPLFVNTDQPAASGEDRSSGCTASESSEDQFTDAPDAGKQQRIGAVTATGSVHTEPVSGTQCAASALDDVPLLSDSVASALLSLNTKGRSSKTSVPLNTQVCVCVNESHFTLYWLCVFETQQKHHHGSIKTRVLACSILHSMYFSYRPAVFQLTKLEANAPFHLFQYVT